MFRRYALLTALAVALSPVAAGADWLFTPNVGSTFGGSARNNEQFTYGATIGWMGAGIFGWEADLSYTPTFFDQKNFTVDLSGADNVVSWMANAVVGVPVGGQHGGGFRPYLSGGLGVLQTNVRSGDQLFDVNNNDFGFNLGAGAMGFVSDHIGFRGDVRYFRSFEDPHPDGNFDIGVGKFNYWRGTAGLTFRW